MLPLIASSVSFTTAQIKKKKLKKPDFPHNFVLENIYHLARQSENGRGYIFLQR